MTVEHTVTTISTTPQQVLSGTGVGTGSFAQCSSCHHSIGEGSDVALGAHRLSDEARWTTATIHCARCLPDHGTITTPTTGAAEIVVSGRLTLRGDAATQGHRLVFTADEGPAAVLDYADADEGSAAFRREEVS
ncbi:hypothetical protein [Halococcus qingdaonensis]|uniref:hypothetical protein n=1 Tax=Halococcus qingdaonensis TaxID=224402 RepID=UPI002116E1E3|nr:hypothetical protein [Halococcus qingdaonensis]